MFADHQVAAAFVEMGITHVVTVPDSTIGPWYPALRSSGIRLVQVCREGEAWAIAAGLYLGGSHPLVLIQCTGLFESGDSLRNAVHDYQLPLHAWIGYRSYLSQSSIPGDTARIYTEPILKAWNLPYVLVDRPDQLPLLVDHYRECRTSGIAGVGLFAEGKV